MHGFNGADYCGTCGSLTCPSYRPPRRREQARACTRCGVPKRDHAELSLDVVMIAPGICPRWVAPDPLPIRIMTGMLLALARLLDDMGRAAWQLTMIVR